MIHRPENFTGDREIITDFCVIGSGPGGATVAKELSERGYSVALLEAGPLLNYRSSTREPGEFFHKYLQESGLRVVLGNAFIVTMQAEALGGTSEINSAIFKRAPDHVMKEWIEDYALKDLSIEEMHEHFDHLEQEIGAQDTEASAQGRKNEFVKRGFDRMGWDSHPLVRAVKGCEGASDCMTGCPSGAKRTMSATYVPWALRAGADVYTLCRAQEILVDQYRRRACGVKADILDPETREKRATLTVRTRKAVVSSAGVVWSPLLLRRAGVKGNGWVGRNLCMHVGVAAIGGFEEEVAGWYGATQGWGSNALYHRGMVMETIWAMPAIFSARLPGIGLEFLERLKNYKHCTAIAVKPRGCSRGMVREVGGQPMLFMRTRQEDVDEIALGMKASIDALFAAGAKEVFPGCFGVPWVMTEPSESELMLKRRFRPGDFEYVGNHVFGTCRMGGNPEESVVDSWCETHELRDLFVCDSSIIPTGMINNPQETIMAFSRRAALDMAQRYAA